LRFDCPKTNSAQPRIFVGHTFACDTVPQVRPANMHRRRRRIAGPLPGQSKHLPGEEIRRGEQAHRGEQARRGELGKMTIATARD
jgi:hypothetical protein